MNSTSDISRAMLEVIRTDKQVVKEKIQQLTEPLQVELRNLESMEAYLLKKIGSETETNGAKVTHDEVEPYPWHGVPFDALHPPRHQLIAKALRQAGKPLTAAEIESALLASGDEKPVENLRKTITTAMLRRSDIFYRVVPGYYWLEEDREKYPPKE